MVTSIENLSEDVLLKIFDYMDGKTLKNATLVCKLLEEILEIK